MTTKTDVPRIETGVQNLDAILQGGLPKGSLIAIGGPPGSGKTILAQQIAFNNASAQSRALLFSTLSEPTAKTLRYLKQLSYFDAKKLEQAVQFVDLGVMLRTKGLEQTAGLITTQLKKVKPAFVIIDSFKVFDDLASSREELRKFGYEIAVNLMAWEVTALLLGEYGPRDYETNPLFSIVDGLITVEQRESSGEQQRFIQVIKMRGTEHSRDAHPFVITKSGIEIFASRVTLRREPEVESSNTRTLRCDTGISKLNELLGEGIPRGSSLLLAGVAGTGKTVLLLEFIYHGAQAGEKGILFSFEETEARLRATARGLGWDFDDLVERGMIEIVFIPQPEILVEAHLLMMRERIEAFGARRVAVDSMSVFLHKVRDPQICREKIFQLASVIQKTEAVGFFATDIPYGSNQISRFGVEETVVDGIILLTSTEEGMERERYIEIYKLRNTAHLYGRHNMEIGPGGITIFPRYSLDASPDIVPAPVEIARRLASGIDGLDALLDGGLLERSVTLLSGSAGIGKSTFGGQFLAEGAKGGEPGLYVSLEEGSEQILRSADALGVPLRKAVEAGIVKIVYLSRKHLHAAQLLTILTDQIESHKPRRLVFDSVGHLLTESLQPDELRQLLYSLVVRFKGLGLTSVFTIESKSLLSTAFATEAGFSPVADNVIMLRYRRMRGQLEPVLLVIKTRGSAHDRGVYLIDIAEGGMRIRRRVGADALSRAKRVREKPQRGAAR
jgi:circadian clock protein KaiC